MQTQIAKVAAADNPRWFVDGCVRACVPDVWPVVWPIIKRAVDRFPDPDQFTEMELLTHLMLGEMQLWLVVDMRKRNIAAAAVTSLIDNDDHFPDQLVFEVPFVAGYGMQHWIGALLKLLSEYGKSHGATVMLGYGRKGWERVIGFDKIGETDNGIRVMARTLIEES